MNGPGAPKPKRFRYVDSLRALAAYAVVWIHVSEVHVKLPLVREKGTALNDIVAYMDTGRIGVVTFFIISGFVIPFSLRQPTLSGAKRFLVRRFWRLYPAYWFAVVVGYLVVQRLNGDNFPLGAAAVNFTMVQGALGFPSVMGHFWTLETELVFYGICLLYFMLGLLRRAGWIIATIIFLWYVTRQVLIGHIYLEGFEVTVLMIHISWMFWGMLFRFWDEDGRPWRSRKALALSLTMGLLLWHPTAALIQGLGVGDESVIRYGLSYILGPGLFVFGTMICRTESRLLSHLGEISYSVYLLHPAVFSLGLWLCTRPSAPEFLRSQHLSVYLAFYFAVCSLVGAAAYRWIEKPAIALGQRLTRS